jgi:hypothetical protein
MRVNLIDFDRFLFDTLLLRSLRLKLLPVIFIDIKRLRSDHLDLTFRSLFLNRNYLFFLFWVLSFDILKRGKIVIEPLYEGKMEMIEKLDVLDLIPAHVIARLILRESKVKAWLRKVRTKISLLRVQ